MAAMAAKGVEFEASEYDTADVLAEDALIDTLEEQFDAEQQRQRAAEQQAAALRHAVEACLTSCLASVDMLYVSREEAPVSAKAQAHNSWQQEAEPSPCSLDTWLRGVIPEETAPPSTSASAAAAVAAAAGPTTPRGQRRTGSAQSAMGSGRRSVAPTDALNSTLSTAEGLSSSGRVSSAGKGSMSGRAASASSAAAGAAGGLGTGSRPGSQPSRVGTAASAASGASAHRTFKVAAADVATAKKLSTEQQEAEDRLRDELLLRRQQEATAKELKRKDEEARNKVAALQRELKGKEYSYDHRGQVVLLNRVNPDTLPAQPTPAIKIQEPLPPGGPPAPAPPTKGTIRRHSNAGTQHSEGGAHGSSNAAGGSGTTANRRVSSPAAGARSGSPTFGSHGSRDHSSGGALHSTTGGTHSGPHAGMHGGMHGTIGNSSSSTGGRDFIEAPSRAQPSALSTMKLGPGVTLRQGAAAKSGPKRDGSSAQMTRTQYQQAAAVAKAQQESKPKKPKAVAVTQPPATAATAATAGAVAGATAAGTVGQEGAGAALGTDQPQQQPGSEASPPLSALLAVALPPATAKGASATAKDASAASSFGPGSLRPASPDVNLVLVTAADWGSSGAGGFVPPVPVPVTKPGVKELKEEFGRINFLPKMRASVATIKPPRQVGG